jgi:hypothetical protein
MVPELLDPPTINSWKSFLHTPFLFCTCIPKKKLMLNAYEKRETTGKVKEEDKEGRS